MLVDVRPVNRLRGPEPLDVASCIGPIMEALREDSADLARIRVVCDWIQYKSNFREAIQVRPIVVRASRNGAAIDPEPGYLELAVDLRRAGEVDLKTATLNALADSRGRNASSHIHLESWTPASKSIIWRFNALYWQALGAWEAATGVEYERTLPGGRSDALNRDAAGELIADLFSVWDDLDDRNALPDELYVVELGVGNGNQAKAWLDEFVVRDSAHGRDYYRRLHYLMCDYSPHVLARAQRAVGDHAARASALVLDATDPLATLGFLRYKVFLVYVSNVYDNLPSDEIARIAGRAHQVEVRAYLPEQDADRVAAVVGASAEEIPALVDRLLRLGPDLMHDAHPGQFPSTDAAVEFWRACWAALRLDERYVPFDGLDRYEVAPSLTGEIVRPVLEVSGDVRMHVNNGAVASFAGTLPLLHPFGRIHCHDLFVTDVDEYHTGFHGPGKYDGSVVNWVNGPLLQRVGGRQGYDVSYAPFGHRQGTSVKTLSARVRE